MILENMDWLLENIETLRRYKTLRNIFRES